MADPGAANPIEAVVAELIDIEQRLPPNDGVRVFARVYREVTQRVQRNVTADFFANPEFLVDLDVTFANVFLQAESDMRRGRKVPKAWAPLAERRTRAGIVPVQFALAGMNAHINHDLAVALVATCERRKVDPNKRGVRADYERVNLVLAQVVRPIRQSFLDRTVVEVGRPLTPAADLVSNFSLDKARDAAWISAMTLWHLRHINFLESAARANLASTVGMVSRHMLTAVVSPGSRDVGLSLADIEDLLDADTVADTGTDADTGTSPQETS